METVLKIIWIFVALGVPAVLATLLMAFPERVIRWQARLYQKGFKDALQMSDDQVDRIPLLPWTSF